jgi:hypothetical protein
LLSPLQAYLEIRSCCFDGCRHLSVNLKEVPFLFGELRAHRKSGKQPKKEKKAKAQQQTNG